MLLGYEGIELTDIAFGGTFDPPHEGHRSLVRRVLESFPYTRIWIIPAKAPAGAHGQHKVPGSSFQQRLAMCQLAFAEELKSGSEYGARLKIDPLEEQLPEPNFTYATLEVLRSRQAEARWGLLMGRDQLISFAGWHRPLEILQMASLVVVDRETQDDPEPSIQLLGSKLGLELDRLGGNAWKWRNKETGIIWLKGCVSPAASREIRSAGEMAFASEWLSPAVASYIKEQGLYRQKEV